jgi:hypothetical protein
MNTARPSLTLLDLSDRELLLLLRDAADGTGFADARDIAARLDLTGDHPHRSVAVRLSWLVRYGAVEREHARDERGNIRYHRNGKAMTTQRWGLTDLGLAMATGKLTKSQEKTLEAMGGGSLLMATRFLSRKIRGSDEQTGKLFDREYRHGLGRR